MQCQCESVKCNHDDNQCDKVALFTAHTIYGKFELCWGCARNLPDEFYKDPAQKRRIHDLSPLPPPIQEG